MDNVFSKLITIILCAIMVFVIPTLYIELFLSTVRYNEARMQTKMLIDSAISKGCITSTMYDTYNKNISFENKGKAYVQIKRKVAVYDEDKVKYNNIVYTNSSIEKQLERNGCFECQNGDEIYIEIDENYNSGINVIFNNLFGFKLSNNKIRYGGIVKNEII